MTSCEAHDISAVDIHYHSSCYIKFALKSLSATAAEEYNMLQLNFFKGFAYWFKNVLYVERRLFSSAIYLKTSNIFVRKTVLKIHNYHFEKENHRYFSWRSFILSKWEILDYTLRWCKSLSIYYSSPEKRRLRDCDIRKSFGNMIRTKFRSIKSQNIYPTWPYSPGEKFDL